MSDTNGAADALGLLDSLFSDLAFQPEAPTDLHETGLNEGLVDALLLKTLAGQGSLSGRQLTDLVCLPFAVVEQRLQKLRGRQLVGHGQAAALGDYQYVLSAEGRERARVQSETNGYVGPAPVPLVEYVLSVEAQSIMAESPRREQLEQAFADVSVEPELLEQLGPAVNSGSGMFIYGAPGNGKSTLAERITLCFGQSIWIPHAIWAHGEIVTFHDPAYHTRVLDDDTGILKKSHDRRWLRVERPTVICGGELTMEALELRYDPKSRTSEAPLQLKSNCGSLFIDDFGRQRMDHAELLNRWIVPLEKRHDFLQLASGKKIQVPFDQLIIFSTNLEPRDLVDEAFLRRIPYKIHVGDPGEAEFRRLFESAAESLNVEFDAAALDYLLDEHYRPHGRAMRRCHPRDLLLQIHNYCRYADLPPKMAPGLFDQAVGNYFTVLGK